MKVIILAGGQGTRLREETEYRPKPLVEVGGRPILWHIMKSYAHFGFLDFIVCLGYRGRMIKEYFLDYEAMNNDFTICLGEQQEISYHGAHEEQEFRVTLAETGLDSMTGARVKKVQRFVEGDLFMVTYGDGVCDVDIRALTEFHKSHGKLATLTTVRPTSRFGVIDIDDRSAVTNFLEKPQSDGWINAGYFVFDRRVFDYLPDDPSCILEREPLEKLARDGQLQAFRHEGFFYAMDTYREYQHLNELWDTRQAPWARWDRRGRQPGA
ncbi:MAG: glucose-1-phosphate cytidylyltransferase [Gemmatimonadaceae bacterium]|nr:glucose-1-phosphate cytidylyltransferase [Gemmatimonadaceae bacterium]